MQPFHLHSCWCTVTWAPKFHLPSHQTVSVSSWWFHPFSICHSQRSCQLRWSNARACQRAVRLVMRLAWCFPIALNWFISSKCVSFLQHNHPRCLSKHSSELGENNCFGNEVQPFFICVRSCRKGTCRCFALSLWQGDKCYGRFFKPCTSRTQMKKSVFCFPHRSYSLFDEAPRWFWEFCTHRKYISQWKDRSSMEGSCRWKFSRLYLLRDANGFLSSSPGHSLFRCTSRNSFLILLSGSLG